MIIRYKKYGIEGDFEHPEAFELTYDEDERVGLYLAAGSEMPTWRDMRLELTVGNVVFETTGRIHRVYETARGEEMSVVPFLEVNIGQWKGRE